MKLSYVPGYTNHFKVFSEGAFSIFLSDSPASLLKTISCTKYEYSPLSAKKSHNLY
jgi:hypothetical protein